MRSGEIYYISGWEALNIPDEKNQIADWHPYLLYSDNKALKLYTTKNSILQEKGIKRRYIDILKQEYYVADYARAIADLVCFGKTQGLKNCVNDFLNKEEEEELFEYLQLLPKKKHIEEFMKYELTKLYLRNRKENNQ